MAWSKRHGEILRSYFDELDKAGIKFFVIRNYEGLPECNSSKDVDIILKHGTVLIAEQVLKQVFKKHGLKYFYRVKIEENFVCRAIDVQEEFAIHVDLINGYINHGVELFSFEELYAQTEEYNGFRVMNELYNGIMLFVYKQFGYKKPHLKQEYQEAIYETWKKYPAFSTMLSDMIGGDVFELISKCIQNKDFERMLSYSSVVTNRLRKYSNKKDLIKNTYRKLFFVWQKVNRVIFQYRKYEKSISVMAPDGTGKTTFLQALLDKLAFLYVDDPNDLRRFHVYHFRPSLLPNLGEVGEKVNLMKQDKDFTNPHRAKPAGFLSSLFRISYYWLDYVVGWMCFTRKDVQYDYYTVYDRYSYDLLVDPLRTRLSLPYWVRRLYVACMPHPKLNFFLKASSEVIISRKKELTLEEIQSQIRGYTLLSDKDKRIVTLDADKSVDELVNEAMGWVVKQYWDKL